MNEHIHTYFFADHDTLWTSCEEPHFIIKETNEMICSIDSRVKDQNLVLSYEYGSSVKYINYHHKYTQAAFDNKQGMLRNCKFKTLFLFLSIPFVLSDGVKYYFQIKNINKESNGSRVQCLFTGNAGKFNAYSKIQAITVHCKFEVTRFMIIINY